MSFRRLTIGCLLGLHVAGLSANPGDKAAGSRWFETEIRTLLVKHCYECHSEAEGQRKGGLLLDRESGWLKGGDTEKAVVPGEPDASLLIRSVRHQVRKLEMPPEYPLAKEEIAKLVRWVEMGAPGPVDDMGQTKFSRLGDQTYLTAKASKHWSFQPVRSVAPPMVDDAAWSHSPIDQFVFLRLRQAGLQPSRRADPRALIRRLTFDLSGLPPTASESTAFVADPKVADAVEHLLARESFGEHFGRLWLDVARYADTDSTYRADTKTPHYYPFAFTYRDYVIRSFNEDKPYDQFIREQLAADRLGLPEGAPELAALGFLTVGPHRRNTDNAIDDWIDTTSRGLLGLTVACARCHDHKFEPVPTADYYSLYGVFASVSRPDPLNEEAMPKLAVYQPDASRQQAYEQARAKIEKSIKGVGRKVARNNNRSLAEKIRETELAELLLFDAGAPARAMVVKEARRPVEPYVFIRGERQNRGPSVPRRFIGVLSPDRKPFSAEHSGRLDLADRIVATDNPLTARVFVNRVWGFLMGDHLVDTPSDFGLQGDKPSHPDLLDWLAADFMDHGWSLKHLVRQIVLSRTYQQQSGQREDAAARDAGNRLFWRANRKHLGVEAVRDSLLFTAGQLDANGGGHPGMLWGANYSRRRSIYGYVNRFNLDPTLRAFDFPSAMQSASRREESIVAQQALFTMNSPFVIDQAVAVVAALELNKCPDAGERVRRLYEQILQREPYPNEVFRASQFVEQQERFFDDPKARISSPWPLVAQAIYMSNEFQYVD